MMRVLVTGAGGFIGSHVVSVLARQGHEVFAVLRKGSELSRPPAAPWYEPDGPRGLNPNPASGIPVVTGRNGCQARQCGRVHVVELELNHLPSVRSTLQSICPVVAIHLAWYTEPAKYWSAPENLDCLAMSLGVARALAECGCKRLVAAGTCAEYDWNYEELSEEITPIKPRGLYGICKNALRETLELFCRQASIQFAWLRFFYLYGPGEARERLVPSIILQLLKGQTAQCGSGETIRDFLYAEDAAAAVAAVAGSSETGPVNIASGQPVKIHDLLETIADIMGRRDCVAIGTKHDSGCEPQRLIADPRRLFNRFAWKPAFGMREGLARTVNWWEGVNRWEQSAALGRQAVIGLK